MLLISCDFNKKSDNNYVARVGEEFLDYSYLNDQIPKNISIEDLESEYNVGFLIGGSTSVQGNKFRFNIELLDACKQKLVLSISKDY